MLSYRSSVLQNTSKVGVCNEEEMLINNGPVLFHLKSLKISSIVRIITSSIH